MKRFEYIVENKNYNYIDLALSFLIGGISQSITIENRVIDFIVQFVISVLEGSFEKVLGENSQLFVAEYSMGE